MSLRTLVVLCLFTLGCRASSLNKWCVNDNATDAYQSALEYLGSSTINHLPLQRLIDDVFLRAGCHWQMTPVNNMSCEQCLSSYNVYEILQLPENECLNRSTFHRSSTIIVSFIFQFTDSCDVSNHRNWSQLSYSHFSDQVLKLEDLEKDHDHEEHHEDEHGEHEDEESHEHDDDDHSDHDKHDEDDEHFSRGQLEHLLREIADNYQPGVSAELDRTHRKQLDLTCSFGNLGSFSSADIYEAVNPASPDRGIARQELGKMSSILIMKLLSGECIQRVEKDVPVPTEFVRSIYRIYASERDTCRLSVEDIETMMSKLGVESSHEDDDDDHDDHSHKRRRRRRQTQQADHVKPAVDSTCYSAEQLLKSFDVDETNGVTRSDFHRLCPALVQQASHACQSSTATTTNTTDDTKPSDTEVYGYGTASVFVITIVSLCGLLIVRFRHTNAYRYVINLMLGLGVGTLVSDAMLHLIPHGIGLHAHDDHSDHDVYHGDGTIVIKPYVWKMLCATFTIYFFFILQSILEYISLTYKQRQTASKINGIGTSGKYTRRSRAEVAENIETTDVSECDGDNTERSHGPRLSVASSHDSELLYDDKTVAWMVMVGDAVHNFADGMAIGASFTVNWQTGLATSIAAFCHELPHEFGDVAIMLSTGWSTLKVAIFQLVSGATAFIGLYVGISVAQHSAQAQQWIFVVAAAMFLYIALSDVVPELFDEQKNYGPLAILIMSNIGILLGTAVMLVLAIFESVIVLNI